MVELLSAAFPRWPIPYSSPPCPPPLGRWAPVRCAHPRTITAPEVSSVRTSYLVRGFAVERAARTAALRVRSVAFIVRPHGRYVRFPVAVPPGSHPVVPGDKENPARPSSWRCPPTVTGLSQRPGRPGTPLSHPPGRPNRRLRFPRPFSNHPGG
ncbi:hypothetical protein GCM10009663_08690 [Kitasatospora arboriphila]|uniref:Uncharacterized protein n=1 Tax=Kitasatospora arboriphila TaxID=258052 RepID=A0ABN1TD42_9ACTN